MAKERTSLLKKIIFDDKALFILCMLLAVFVWISTSLNSNIDDSRTMTVSRNVEISDAISEQTNMNYFVKEDKIDFSISLEGPKYTINQIKKDDFEITFDTSKVTDVGDQFIPIKISLKNTKKLDNVDAKIVSYEPTSIRVFYDVSDSKEFPIELDVNELDIADGYIIGDQIISEDKVIISGPKSKLNKIEKVFVQPTSDASDITQQITENFDIKIQGQTTDFLFIHTRANEKDAIKQVTVTIPVYKLESLQVAVDYDNKPEKLIKDSVDTVFSVKKLQGAINGDADVDKAMLGTIDYNRLTLGDNEFSFDVSNIDGVSVVDDKLKEIKAVVTVNEDIYRKTDFTVTAENVVTKNVPVGKKVNSIKIDNTSVSVISPKDVNVELKDVMLLCDLSTKSDDDVYKAILMVKDHDDSWVYGQCNVTIKYN